MKKLTIILFFTMGLLSSNAYANNPYSYIEPLIREGRIEEARKEALKVRFNSHGINKYIKSYLKGRGSREKPLWHASDIVISHQIKIKKCRDKMMDRDSTLNCDINPLPEYHPFTHEFGQFLISSHNQFVADYNKELEIRQKIWEEKKAEKLRIAKEQEEQRVQEEAERLRLAQERKAQLEREKEQKRVAREDRKKEKLADKMRKEEEFARNFRKIKNKAKELGYENFYNATIVQVVATTQKNGGLEKYLNAIAGCVNKENKTCRRYYKDLKIIQVLENGALYSYSKVIGRDYISFTVYLNGLDKNKIYQEGQAFENALYSFQGMLSYQTALGTTKSVPSFKKVVDIKQY